jgi:hypothetical protein
VTDLGETDYKLRNKRELFSDRSVVPWNLRLALGRSQCCGFTSFSSVSGLSKWLEQGSVGSQFGYVYGNSGYSESMGLLAPKTVLMGGTLAVLVREPCLHR